MARTDRRWKRVPGTAGVYQREGRFRINFRDASGTVFWRVTGDRLDDAIRCREELPRLKKAGILLPPLRARRSWRRTGSSPRALRVYELADEWLIKLLEERPDEP